jgi:hypothetical protein
VAQAANSAVLAAGLQPQDAESLGDHHLLDLVIGRGDTLEDLEALKGGGTTGGLVGNHAADGLVEDTRGGAEVEGTCQQGQTCCSTARERCRVSSEGGGVLTTAGGVVSGHLAEVGVVLDCIHIVSIRPHVSSSSCVGVGWISILAFRSRVSGGLRTLSTEELSGDVQGLGADDDDLLAAEQLLSDNAGQTAQKVALAIDDDLKKAETVSIADCGMICVS